MSWLAFVAAAYLLGSISFSLWIGRSLGGFDIRERGSGNAGATNVLRLVGRGPAVLALVLDVAKGAAPVLLARAAGAPGPIVGAAAAAAVFGHVFPVLHGFRGGKGVATAAGALGSLAPAAAGLAALVFLAVVAATRFVSLASVAAAAGFPLLLFVAAGAGWTPAPPPWLVASALATALLIAARHHGNLHRLRAGTEPRLGDPHPERAPAREEAA